MILQRLAQFADRIPDACPPMYSRLEFRWQIQLDADGTFRGITPLSDGGTRNRGLNLLTPNVKRSGTKAPPLLLADFGKYALGHGDESPAKSGRFLSFVELVRRCSEMTREPAVDAVLAFLLAHRGLPIQIPETMSPDDRVCFRVGDVRPVDLPTVRDFWVDVNPPKGGKIMQCLLCGHTRPVDQVAPVAIKGLTRLTKKAEMQIVAANKEAFLSYGAEQALTAPTCRICGEAYANSLNFMIANDRYHLFVGPCVFMFWTGSESDFDPGALLSKPEEEDVKRLLDSYRTGETAVVDAAAFYAMSVSGSGARVVIRDWLETTVPAVQTHLARWFGLQKTVDIYGADGRPLGVFPLAASLYPDKKANDQIVASVPRAMVRCALYGGMLPESLLAQAVGRNRAEQGVTRKRAALIKAVLLSQMNDFEEGYMEKLDTSIKTPGYLCGCLLAELEAAQYQAVRPKATLVDRYYGAASASPAIVYGSLLRGLQPHMSKLRKERPGVYRAIDSRIQDIMHDLGDFPKTLNLKEQAHFALGYYHQKAENRAAAIAHTADKNNNTKEEE